MTDRTADPSPQSSRGCRRFGCAGCLVSLLLATIAVGAIAWKFAAAEAPELRREQPVREIELPEGPWVLSIDLRHGNFALQPGPAGEPFRIEADYDASIYDLTVQESAGGARQEIAFGAGVGWWSTLGRTARNSMTITVPQGSAFSLEGRLGVGRSRLEFGGLSVDSIDLITRTGDHEILFSRPLPEPMERLRIEGATSSLFVGDLGNGSPVDVEIVHRMGRLDLDLRGNWRRAATVVGRVSLGDVMIRRPDSAQADFSECSVQMGERETIEPTGPAVGVRVDVDLDVSFGDLAIR